MHYFDIEKFWRKLKELKLGSGTLAERAGVLPDDVQKLVTLGCIDDEIGEKIVDILSEDVLEDSLKNDEEGEILVDPESKVDSTEAFAVVAYTINQIKEKIEKGEIGLEEVLDLEKLQDEPRTTLTTWIEEQLEEQ